MRKENEEITLQTLWDMYLPRLWIVALVAVIGAILMGSYTLFIKKDTYTTTVEFSTRAEEGNTNTTDLNYAQSMVATFREYIQFVGFRSHVLDKLYALEDNGVKRYDNEDVDVKDLLNMVSISQRGNTSLFVVTVVAEDLQLSQDIAKIIEVELPIKLKDDLKHAAEVASYLDVPEEPDGKGTILNTVIGFAVGLVLSLVAIFFFVHLDTTIRSKKKLEESFDLPVIGVIPGISAEAKAAKQ